MCEQHCTGNWPPAKGQGANKSYRAQDNRHRAHINEDRV